jgi:hypothetical protein
LFDFVAESPEHSFLKQTFLEVLDGFSSLRLFGVTEVQRRTFDFGCNLQRDWTLPLVGQVDWRNRSGLDKDLRTLFAEQDAAIRVLLIRDGMANHLRLSEILKALGQREYELFTLKVFPVPPDFDADREDHRQALRQELHERIASDILFNVVFGGLTADNMRFFAFNTARLNAGRGPTRSKGFGTFGTTLAVLHSLATTNFVSNGHISRELEISSSHAREAILVLEGAGFVARFDQADSGWRVTLRGRVFLELLGRIGDGFRNSQSEGELGYLLRRLQCGPDESIALGRRGEDGTSPAVLDALVLHIEAARGRWGVDVGQQIRYVNVVPESPASG